MNDRVRVIRPHPSFRLFATLNPKYGDISRAMRNRAVEVNASPLPIPSIEVATLCANVALEVALANDNNNSNSNNNNNEEEKFVNEVDGNNKVERT